MKLLFLCGSLEPGRDGVGDYTRRLCGELILQGHGVQIIALNDKHITSNYEEIQKDELIKINCFRLSSKFSWKERITLAKKFVDRFDPEWLSLQFVPFSFQGRGLPFGLAKNLMSIAGGRKWHIMFHELWLGLDKESSLKFKLWGLLQREIVLNLLKIIQPTRINTHSQIYQQLLFRANVSCTILPLMSNIRKTAKITNKDNSALTCVVFGGIHGKAPISSFLNELKGIANLQAKELKFLFVGRNGVEIDEWKSELEKKDVRYEILGECRESEISQVLSMADWGISTTPYYLLEKSGTVAAMLEHNLKVICVARSWTPTRLTNKVKIPFILEFIPGQLKRDFFDSNHYVALPQRKSISKQLLENLN